ncbi:MAG: hypothetical protein MJZ81_10005 [Bacteroidales bacterium]|nr:hypothetical protein [Bacteroidales bacterium]
MTIRVHLIDPQARRTRGALACALYLLTLVTQDGHRHTVRLLKQSEVFGN